ncbi:MAG: hypothetical protein IT349_19270 [Candidatus Eisenbacteria bacterium]|nr:hypothetical protein [Candidatus Eisenbacteria bacterium]
MAERLYDRFELGLDVRQGKTVSDANRLRTLKNAHPTTGRYLRKRPCLKFIAQLEAGTKGLKGSVGKLNTFYESGSITHANSLFSARKVAHPTTTQLVTKAHYCDVFLGYIYCSIEYADGSVWHHYLDGSSPTHVADANCPHSKSVVKAVQSLFGPKGENVRFCATDDARDWTTASNAGFLPVGLQAEGTTEPTGVATRKEQLAVFFVDGVQIWTIDPDPAKMALATRVGGVGSRFPKTAKLVSGDLFFLSDYGFKSITVTEFETNLRDIDIGSPIDDLIRNQLSASDDPLAVYYQANGQYLVIFPTYAWCFTFSRSGKLAGWAQWTFPFTMDDATELNAKVYMRSGDNVYELDTLTYKDGDSSIPLVEILMPYIDMALPGRRKMFLGFDFIGKGTAKLRFRLDPRKGKELVMTDWIEVSGDDTREGPQYPLVAATVSLAPEIHHQSNEEFELHGLNFYYEDLGPT